MTPTDPRAQAAPLLDDAQTDRLAEIGARLVLRALAENPVPVPQPAEGMTYAPKLAKADSRLDWREDAAALEACLAAAIEAGTRSVQASGGTGSLRSAS